MKKLEEKQKNINKPLTKFTVLKWILILSMIHLLTWKADVEKII